MQTEADIERLSSSRGMRLSDCVRLALFASLPPTYNFCNRQSSAAKQGSAEAEAAAEAEKA